jgi:hypothetical protein
MDDSSGNRIGGGKFKFPGGEEIDPEYRNRELYIKYNVKEGMAHIYGKHGYVGDLKEKTRNWLFGKISPSYKPPELPEKEEEEIEVISLQGACKITFPEEENIKDPYRGKTFYVAFDLSKGRVWVHPGEPQELEGDEKDYVLEQLRERLEKD